MLLVASDGSSPRLGSGSARARPFLEGLSSIFWEGPRLGLGPGSMSKPGSLWRAFQNEKSILIWHKKYKNMDFWWVKFEIHWVKHSCLSAKPKQIFKPLYNFFVNQISLKNTWQIGHQMKMDTRGLKLGLGSGSARARSIFEGPRLDVQGSGSNFQGSTHH